MAKEKGKPKEVAKSGEVEPVRGRAMSPFEEMERMMDEFFPRGGMRPWRGGWGPRWSELAAPFEGGWPKVDVVEKDDQVVVRAEVPGVKKEDLDVSITDNTVTIRGSTQEETKEEEGDYYRREISRGSFSRTVTLPGGVNGDKAKASFNDGMLELTLPKEERSKRRKIKVE
ncbi:MAG TPA: Hsp20/alpha crystallin family protein [Gammaproteobacteria bacterium]|nr:Hsp20/alpha crystallin family protein [Gammaproteobacteria bacterium]